MAFPTAARLADAFAASQSGKRALNWLSVS